VATTIDGHREQPHMKERGKAAGIKGCIVTPFKGDAVLATFKKPVEGCASANGFAQGARPRIGR
jgi:hypothetical protein